MGETRTGVAASLGLRSARRHHQLRARHSDLLCDAGARDRRRADVGAVFDPNRNELFTAERGVGAWLQRRAAARLDHGDAHRRGAGDRVSLRHRTAPRRICSRCLARSSSRRARCVASARRRSICAGSAAGRMDGFWEQGLQAWDTMAGALIVQEAGGRVTALDGGAVERLGGSMSRVATARSTTRCSLIIRAQRCPASVTAGRSAAW